ncbi:hypothetical protein ANN_27709 [Periplaneta americana]|uniref:PiggyBac transposable element-derived protein domain-containing protein n=1 Tax=Periplaneta americana TaxID=6978 RepID=A0ABQ8RV05_PERAM|nr:hypothetical protein ANN_27709 [Periplaneta americana]
MFCETKSDVHNELVSNTMRRSRFTEIHKYLHLSDNFSLPPNDEFGKVRRYFEILNDNFGQQFEKVWSSHKSIHETMVPYLGDTVPIRIFMESHCVLDINYSQQLHVLAVSLRLNHTKELNRPSRMWVGSCCCVGT